MGNITFDAAKLRREVEKKAAKAYFDAVERAKRSLGSDSQSVKVTPYSVPRRSGSGLEFGNIEFDSEDVRTRFELALQRELK